MWYSTARTSQVFPNPYAKRSGGKSEVVRLNESDVCEVVEVDLSNDELERRAAADRREVHPPIQVETALSSKAGQLDWWVKERQEWLGRVRAADGRQRWIRAVDLRPTSGSETVITR
jgi:hypothetical protein